MSQLPQNNEDFDYDPEYAKLYQANDSLQSDVDDADDWMQPASEQPSDVQREQAGERAANFSLLFGFLSPLSFFLGCWLIVRDLGKDGLLLALMAPLLNILGILQASVARRRGTRALEGRILNWLGICIFIGIAFLIMLIANALSNMSNMH